MADKDIFGKSSHYYTAPSGRSSALKKQFKDSVRKARVKGIDTRTIQQKERDWKKEAEDRASRSGVGDGDRSQALQKAALQPIVKKYKFLSDQERRRGDILAGKVIPKRSDFTGFEGGVMGLRVGDFTDTGLPKIREGLTSDQYAEFMQELHRRNPTLTQKYFPIGSGKITSGIAEILAPAPLKLASKAWKAVTNPVKTYENFLKTLDDTKLDTIKMTKGTGINTIDQPYTSEAEAIEAYNKMNPNFAPLTMASSGIDTVNQPYKLFNVALNDAQKTAIIFGKKGGKTKEEVWQRVQELNPGAIGKLLGGKEATFEEFNEMWET